MNHTDWSTEPDGDFVHIPDELDRLVNKIGFQIRLHTISGKSEGQTIADLLWITQKFFTEHPELCQKTDKKKP